MKIFPEGRLNSYLDNLVRPEFHAFHKSWSSFKVCGSTGLTLAIFLTMSLVLYRELSLWVLAALVVSAIVTFLVLAMATKIVTGEEQLIYYHHEIAVTAIAALVLGLLHQPILPYLDVIILGIGTFLTCGRVGCLMAGCCHGRPHHWGVCYRQQHADAGFTPYYVGLRLFPIQLVESLWVLTIVLVGVVMVLTDPLAGRAFAWYVITYDIGRFFFEFKRGDPPRAYLWGFSEAQWTSLLLMVIIVGLETYGFVPLRWWHAGATAGLVFVMAAISLKRYLQKTDKHKFLNPRHVKEVARAVERVSGAVIGEAAALRDEAHIVNIDAGCTSLGLQVSAGKITGETECLQHYAFSRRDTKLAEEAARAIAGLILQLKHPLCSHELIRGSHGVFHLLVRNPPERGGV